jgi:hypothetical protein
MPANRQPETLRLSKRAAKSRKIVEFELADDIVESCEVKLPTEMGLADYEEIQRIMDSWQKISDLESEKRLPTITRLIRRMIDIFFFDTPSKEAVDNLDWEQMDALGVFLEGHYEAMTAAMMKQQAKGRRTPARSR